MELTPSTSRPSTTQPSTLDVPSTLYYYFKPASLHPPPSSDSQIIYRPVPLPGTSSTAESDLTTYKADFQPLLFARHAAYSVISYAGAYPSAAANQAEARMGDSEVGESTGVRVKRVEYATAAGLAGMLEKIKQEESVGALVLETEAGGWLSPSTYTGVPKVSGARVYTVPSGDRQTYAKRTEEGQKFLDEYLVNLEGRGDTDPLTAKKLRDGKYPKWSVVETEQGVFSELGCFDEVNDSRLQRGLDGTETA
ncbi:hypothetical protein IAT38_006025 [Cryptococcus sp. DSM 104549]